MSTSHSPVLALSPFGQVERRVPRLPYRLLPGRIALMQHPLLPTESGVLLAAGRNFAVWVCEECGEASRRYTGPRCENCGGTRLTEVRKTIGETDGAHLEPDVCVVADCRIDVGTKDAPRPLATPGDVLVVKPEAGARVEAPRGGWDGWDVRDVRLLGLPGLPWQERILARLTEKGVEPMPGWSLVERERASAGVIELKEAYEPYGLCLSGEGQGARVAWTDRDETYTFLGAPKSWALVKSQRNIGAFSKAC